MQDPRPLYSPRYVRGVIALLAGAVFIEFFHRQLLAVALNVIGKDLALNDTQLGSLVTAFAAAYFVGAIALGRAADRLPRRAIYALGIAFWSALTAAGAATGSFATFLATRVGAGLGQSAAGVTNGPLLADYVTPERRGSAFGLVTMGATLGALVAAVAGGLVIEQRGWRFLFVAGGALGAAYAALFALVVKEPPRGWSEGRAQLATTPLPLREVSAVLRSRPALLHTVAGTTVNSIAVFAAAQWAVVFFERVHGLSTSVASLATAGGAFAGTLGAVAGGVVANRAWTTSPRSVLLIPAVCSGISFPLMWASATAPAAPLAFGLFVAGWVFALVHSAPASAAMQGLIPDRVRSFVTGLITALLTLVGMGGGPFITGLLSDLFGAATDPASIGRALAWVSVLYLWAAVHFALAARSFERDLASAAA